MLIKRNIRIYLFMNSLKNLKFGPDKDLPQEFKDANKAVNDINMYNTNHGVYVSSP